jgi:5-methylcytosine-specific restriction protein B
VPAPAERCSLADILRVGRFLERAEIERLPERLHMRKSLILQGPPGTGKTWIAKRLAFAPMGERDAARIRAVQFHPNLSCEDLVRGWRREGRFVAIITEIDHGNPAQLFGELRTLLEAGKRTPRDALEICYPDGAGVRRPVHVPEDLFVFGTMNIAGRPLCQGCCRWVSEVEDGLRRAEDRTNGGVFERAEGIGDREDASASQHASPAVVAGGGYIDWHAVAVAG